jgi:hypothetical protein
LKSLKICFGADQQWIKNGQDRNKLFPIPPSPKNTLPESKESAILKNATFESKFGKYLTKTVWDLHSLPAILRDFNGWYFESPRKLVDW